MMFSFRNTNIFFGVMLVAFVVLQVLLGWPYYWYFVGLMGYTLLLFYGSFYIGSQFYMPVVCRVATTQKKIALTFDDGPKENFTPLILNILQQYNVKATFFCIGTHAAQHTALLKAMHEQGHLIGNHSFCHGVWFDLLSFKKMKKELHQTHAVVQNTLGVSMRWFRPPYGVTNPTVRKAVNSLHYTAIGWNVRSLDTMIQDEHKLLERMKKLLQPGAIVLLHDTSKATVAMLPQFLQYLQSQQYAVVPLDELLGLPAYEA